MRWLFLLMGSMFYGTAINWFSAGVNVRAAFGIVMGTICVWASDHWREYALGAAGEDKIQP